MGQNLKQNFRIQLSQTMKRTRRNNRQIVNKNQEFLKDLKKMMNQRTFFHSGRKYQNWRRNKNLKKV